MAFKNFIKQGSYSKISRIWMDCDKEIICFSMSVLEKKDGDLLFPSSFEYSLSQNEKIQQSKGEKMSLPVPPEYPQICKDREALVPMWDAESTKTEQDEYKAAKQKYTTDDMKKYQTDYESAVESAELQAKADNEYDNFFSRKKIFEDSNLVAQAYNYLKTLPAFEGVEDDI